MTTVLSVELNPVDPLMFRRTRPFRVGGYAETYLLPPPSTIALAFVAELRLRGLIDAGDFKNVLNRLKEHATFHGPLILGGDLYAPARLDYAKCEHYECGGEVFQLKWGDHGPLLVHGGCGRVAKLLRNHVMSLKAVTQPLKGRLNGLVKELSEICARELRAGLYLREQTKNVVPRYFYQAQRVSLARGYSLLEFISVKSDELKSAIAKLRLLKVGGKGGLVEAELKSSMDLGGYYKSLTQMDLEVAADRIAKDHYFDLVLLTPAIFLEGGRSVWKPAPLPKGFPTDDVELVGAALSKPVEASGWDSALRSPTAMYFAAPAGAVYRYRLKRELNRLEVVEGVIKPVISENVGEWGVIGYGTALPIPKF